MKLYHTLDIENVESTNEIECCKQTLYDRDDDMDLLDSCFVKASDLSDSERASVYYISGYVAFKEQIPATTDSRTNKPAGCEFIDLVSRGRLKYPPPELYDLGLYMLAFFKNRNQKCCCKIFLQAFKEVSGSISDMRKKYSLGRNYPRFSTLMPGYGLQVDKN